MSDDEDSPSTTTTAASEPAATTTEAPAPTTTSAPPPTTTEAPAPTTTTAPPAPTTTSAPATTTTAAPPAATTTSAPAATTTAAPSATTTAGPAATTTASGDDDDGSNADITFDISPDHAKQGDTVTITWDCDLRDGARHLYIHNGLKDYDACHDDGCQSGAEWKISADGDAQTFQFCLKKGPPSWKVLTGPLSKQVTIDPGGDDSDLPAVEKFIASVQDGMDDPPEPSDSLQVLRGATVRFAVTGRGESIDLDDGNGHTQHLEPTAMTQSIFGTMDVAADDDITCKAVATLGDRRAEREVHVAVHGDGETVSQHMKVGLPFNSVKFTPDEASGYKDFELVIVVGGSFAKYDLSVLSGGPFTAQAEDQGDGTWLQHTSETLDNAPEAGSDTDVTITLFDDGGGTIGSASSEYHAGEADPLDQKLNGSFDGNHLDMGECGTVVELEPLHVKAPLLTEENAGGWIKKVEVEFSFGVSVKMGHKEKNRDKDEAETALKGTFGDEKGLGVEMEKKIGEWEGDYGGVSADWYGTPASVDFAGGEIDFGEAGLQLKIEGKLGGVTAAPVAVKIGLKGVVIKKEEGEWEVAVGTIAVEVGFELTYEADCGEWHLQAGVEAAVGVDLEPNWPKIAQAAADKFGEAVDALDALTAMDLLVGVSLVIVDILVIYEMVKFFSSMHDYNTAKEQFEEALEAWKGALETQVDALVAGGAEAVAEPTNFGTRPEEKPEEAGWKAACNYWQTAYQRYLSMDGVKSWIAGDGADLSEDERSSKLRESFAGLAKKQRNKIVSDGYASGRILLAQAHYRSFRDEMSGGSSSEGQLRDNVFQALFDLCGGHGTKYIYFGPGVTQEIYDLAMPDNWNYVDTTVPIPPSGTNPADVEALFEAYHEWLDDPAGKAAGTPQPALEDIQAGKPKPLSPDETKKKQQKQADAKKQYQAIDAWLNAQYSKFEGLGPPPAAKAKDWYHSKQGSGQPVLVDDISLGGLDQKYADYVDSKLNPTVGDSDS